MDLELQELNNININNEDKMDINEIKEKVKVCVNILAKNEKEIIQNDINERTIVHKLAEYLQKEFSDLNVDVEYNRNLEFGQRAPKYADIIKKGFEESYEKAKGNKKKIKEFLDQVTTYPDIIVHERGHNRKNTLVIEVKKNNNQSDWQIDEKKLEAFTRNYDDGYGFLLGMHLVIYVRNKWKNPTYEWYVDGKKENIKKIVG